MILTATKIKNFFIYLNNKNDKKKFISLSGGFPVVFLLK